MKDRRLRVAFCIDNMNIGGTEMNAIRTAERLDRSHIDLRVVCFQADGPLRSRYQAAGIPVHSLPIPNLYAPKAWLQGIRFARYLHDHRVDLVHAHDTYSNVFATFWARLAGVRTIASRRWWEGFPGTGWRVATTMAHRLAVRVLANAPSIVGLLESEGVPKEKISVIPNFVVDESFANISEAERRRWLMELGADPDARIVGVLANLHPVKDHASLLKAAAALLPHYPDLQLLFIGDGSMRKSLEEQAAARGVRSRVVFAGRLGNIPNPHQLFEISVLASYSEGFPNTIVEAMAAARPVVATRVGGIPDAVVDGETGLLVPARSPDQLAEALDSLLSDPERARDMGRAGYDRARKLFSAEAVLPRLEQLYEELVG